MSALRRSGPVRRGAKLAALGATAALLGSVWMPAQSVLASTRSTSSVLSIRVQGNKFVNGSGQVVQFRGVNRPGTEYACVDNLGFTSSASSEGTSTSYANALAASLAAWSKSGAPVNAVDAVRVPLNEDCWLGINGVPAAYSGQAYQQFITDEVDALTARGMYAILDLHWSAPHGYLANSQNVGPDMAHSVGFWKQVANRFKGVPSVMFDLYNEPRIWCYTSACASSYPTAATTAWSCYLNGCHYTYSASDYVSEPSGSQISIAGTQLLVNTIRATGANNVIMVEGLGYANATDMMSQYMPSDPAHNLAVEIHTYPSSGMNAENPSRLNATLAEGNLDATYPVYLGEFGDQVCSGTPSSFTSDTMRWADSFGYSYTAWGWDSGEGCGGPSLVTNDDTGAPSSYGSVVESHLQALEP